MKKEVLVVYLFTGFDKTSYLRKFIKYYKKYKSGHRHKLLISYKLIELKQIKKLRKILGKIKHIEFIDHFKKNDFDFGSYGRIAKKYNKKIIFFMNSHSYPIKKNWLKIIMKFHKNKTIIGSTGSYESIFTSLKIKKIFKIFKHIKNYSKYKKHFYSFPNPHLRTTSFLIKGKDYILFNKNRNYETKEEAWFSESGKNGLTNFFKKKGYKILIANSDSKSFNEDNWINSETYCSKKQSKLLISDNHTRKYEKLSKINKKIAEYRVWHNSNL